MHIPAKKKIYLGGVFFLAAVVMAAFLFLMWQRRKINNIEVFQNYRISYTDSCIDSAELLSRLCQDKLQLRMERASESSHLFLRLAQSEKEAEKIGITLPAINEKGFYILHQGNTIYLLAKSQKGLQRACYYLIYHLVDKDGLLLLELDQSYTDTGEQVFGDILIGSTPLDSCSVICDKAVSASQRQDLIYYINQASGALPALAEADTASPSIQLSIDSSLPAGSFRIEGTDGSLNIIAAEPDSLTDGIRQFANTYLGWMYAGTNREAFSGGSASLRIPSEIRPTDNPWIEEREAIVTLWQVNYSRGVFFNNATSQKNNIMSFSDKQLYDYVRMLKYCGFTGIQVTDMCSAWAGVGSYEYVQERLRFLADAAHSLGMNFTLWVWGSEFTGYGWVDNSVTYSFENYSYAHQNPDVVATFEKYYSIYAELADCCDRVIAHYYDPGNLHISEDIAYFADMLSKKFLSVNPDIDFGISCWVDAFDKSAFVRQLGNQITLYESGHHDNPDEYTPFRNFCKNSGCRLGVWSWNNCEMEIDQLAQMNYNPHIIQSTYQTAMQYDNIMKPEYWSEMDCNHILNVFSLYCAGQMLIDPSRDPEELTHEIAVAAVGTEYADAFADILELIEDARSGDSWDTYWWSSENYILKSDAYAAEDILVRSEQALSVLQEMIDADLEANTLPLPLKLREVLQLIQPHIRQIRDFARFRIGLHEAKDMVAEGLSKDAVQAQIDSIGTPISEYNTVIGLWGQVEARAQQELLLAFCRENDLEMPVDDTFDYERKFRIYSQFVTDQKGKKEIVYHYAPYYQYNMAYDPEVTNRLAMELVEEGLFSVDEATGALYLTDWEHYSYSFN